MHVPFPLLDLTPNQSLRGVGCHFSSVSAECICDMHMTDLCVQMLYKLYVWYMLAFEHVPIVNPYLALLLVGPRAELQQPHLYQTERFNNIGDHSIC